MARSKVIDKDRGWNAIKGRMEFTKAKNHVAVGIQGEDALASHGESTNVEIGTKHEFGMGVPERSFVRATIDANLNAYRRLARTLGTRMVDGGVNRSRALGLLGQKAEADIKNRIRARIDPPLAPVTIDRKGSSVPLIDTGQMINAITSEVRR